MTVQQLIEAKIRTALAPAHLEVLNESDRHAVPRGSESHFKVVVVSDSFRGQPRIARHQQVNGILADELAGPVHALSLQTHTREEWEARGGEVLKSPLCLGGGRHDRRR
jgi:BolA protein